MSNELTILDWAEEADYQLALIIGGYYSSQEYYECGTYRNDIINTVLDCYRVALSYYQQRGCDKSVFLTDEDIQEEIWEASSSAVMNVAHLHFYNSKNFEKERATLTDEEIDDRLCELENEIWESESCAYSPYCYSDCVYDILKEHNMALISVDISDFEQNIVAFLNDAQNSLFGELLLVGDNVLTNYEDPCLFVRYPKTTLELGSGK